MSFIRSFFLSFSQDCDDGDDGYGDGYDDDDGCGDGYGDDDGCGDGYDDDDDSCGDGG